MATAGKGFQPGLRDILGPESPNTYGVYTVETAFDNHSVMLSAGHKVHYVGVGDFIESQMLSHEARKAYLFHRDTVLTKVVRLEFDANARDSNGDLLAYVYVRPWPGHDNEIFINAELIRMGHARYIPDQTNSRYHSLFEHVQEEAILARRGIWAVEPFVPENE